MTRHPEKSTGGRFISWFLLASLATMVVAGIALLSMIRVEVAAFYAPGNTVYAIGSAPAAIVSEGGPAEEPRAGARVKIQVQPWISERVYGKFAGAVRVGAISGVRWHLRAGSLGRTRGWPAASSPPRACA